MKFIVGFVILICFTLKPLCETVPVVFAFSVTGPTALRERGRIQLVWRRHQIVISALSHTQNSIYWNRAFNNRPAFLAPRNSVSGPKGNCSERNLGFQPVP